MVHGGPGSGCTPSHRTFFDNRCQAVLFDQRGCGRSLPNARDPAVSLTHNTTAQLVDDMDSLRAHLDFEQWMLVPAEHRAFCDHANTPADGPVWAILDAYSALLADPDPQVRTAAARAWHQWEDATVSLEPAGGGAYSSRPLEDMITRARVCSHYFAHSAFLPDKDILDRAHELDGISATLLHGRLDISSPPDTAWHLADAWPSAELHFIDNAGHIDPGHIRTAIQQAIAGHAHRIARSNG